MNPKERKSDIHKASERTFVIFQHRCKQFALSIVQGAGVPQLMEILGVHLILKRQHNNGEPRYRDMRTVMIGSAHGGQFARADHPKLIGEIGQRNLNRFGKPETHIIKINTAFADGSRVCSLHLVTSCLIGGSGLDLPCADFGGKFEPCAESAWIVWREGQCPLGKPVRDRHLHRPRLWLGAVTYRARAVRQRRNKNLQYYLKLRKYI